MSLSKVLVDGMVASFLSDLSPIGVNVQPCLAKVPDRTQKGALTVPGPHMPKLPLSDLQFPTMQALEFRLAGTTLGTSEVLEELLYLVS